MKLAFVHLVRTGGAYTAELLAANGFEPRDPWHLGLNRDFNRQELFDALRMPAKKAYVHGHVVAWDAETVAYAKAQGWRTFTIVRDPQEQLVSLYRYITDWQPPPIDDWLTAQARGEWWHTDYRVWAVPEYKLDLVLPSPSLLRDTFGLTLDIPPINQSRGSAVPSEHALAAVRSSPSYTRYLSAIGA